MKYPYYLTDLRLEEYSEHKLYQIAEYFKIPTNYSTGHIFSLVLPKERLSQELEAATPSTPEGFYYYIIGYIFTYPNEKMTVLFKNNEFASEIQNWINHNHKEIEFYVQNPYSYKNHDVKLWQN